MVVYCFRNSRGTGAHHFLDAITCSAGGWEWLAQDGDALLNAKRNLTIEINPRLGRGNLQHSLKEHNIDG